MAQFNSIRKNILADARHYFLASDVTTEPEQRRLSCAQKCTTARVIAAPDRFMSTAT